MVDFLHGSDTDLSIGLILAANISSTGSLQMEYQFADIRNTFQPFFSKHWPLLTTVYLLLGMLVVKCQVSAFSNKNLADSSNFALKQTYM